ncbi:MAG: hypothetical protein KGI08_07590 [Thaumarchaeota archaeon]|nr:hypothetical protein [Nitrososphaerota archaeon]
MNKKFMTMIALTAMSSMLGVNAFGESQNAYLISGVPLDQVDQSYKNLKIDSTKETYIIYMDSSISVRHTTGTSWVDATPYVGLVAEGNCLNMFSVDSSLQQNDGCFQQFSPVASDFDETTQGNFLILQSK